MTGGVGRADPLAEVLIAQRADVIGVQEADDLTVLRRLSWRINMDFIRAESDLGVVALFSRHRIADSTNLSFVRGIASPALRVTLSIAQRPTTVDVIDLRCDRAATLADDSLPIARCVSVNVPGVPNPTKGHPPRFVCQIWPGVDVGVVDHWIETDRLALYASNHLPVGAELEIP
ncbi:MAG: hypothetical protein QM770_17300 [Tepidisphaeraceae bacterium]